MIELRIMLDEQFPDYLLYFIMENEVASEPPVSICSRRLA